MHRQQCLCLFCAHLSTRHRLASTPVPTILRLILAPCVCLCAAFFLGPVAGWTFRRPPRRTDRSDGHALYAFKSLWFSALLRICFHLRTTQEQHPLCFLVAPTSPHHTPIVVARVSNRASPSMAGQRPVFVVNSAPERQSGRKAQLSNISAAKVRRTHLAEPRCNLADHTRCTAAKPPRRRYQMSFEHA